MKHLQTLLALAALAVAGTATATTIEMTVNGLVCGFCARGIEKTFRKHPATEDVLVSLEHKLVVIATKDGQDIPDDTLRKALKDAGYDVKAISRTERSMATIRDQIRAKP